MITLEKLLRELKPESLNEITGGGKNGSGKSSKLKSGKSHKSHKSGKSYKTSKSSKNSLIQGGPWV